MKMCARNWHHLKIHESRCRRNNFPVCLIPHSAQKPPPPPYNLLHGQYALPHALSTFSPTSSFFPSSSAPIDLCYNTATMFCRSPFANNNNDNDDRWIVGRSMPG